MTKSKFWNQLAIFIIALLAILSVREYFSHRLIEKGIDTYQTHTFLNIGANLLLILVSYYLIKRNGLTKIAVFITLVILPCLIYGLFLMKKYKLTEQAEKH